MEFEKQNTTNWFRSESSDVKINGIICVLEGILINTLNWKSVSYSITFQDYRCEGLIV